MTLIIFFFFFQAEDGIRDRDVTGVQTCALPILAGGGSGVPLPASGGLSGCPPASPRERRRSEERRVGKEWRSGWSREKEKKKKYTETFESGNIVVSR